MRTDDDRDVELVDEALEVERLGAARHVLGGHRGAADDEQVDTRVDDRAPVLLRALRAERPRDDDAGVPDLLQPRADQLGADRRGVDLLHARGRTGGLERGDLGEQRGRVVVPRPQALEVEDAHAAGPAERDGRRGADHGVHGRREDRQVEVVGVDLPADRDLLRVARAPRGHHRDVVEGERPASSLAPSDLDLAAHRTSLPAGGPSPARRPLSGRCSWAPRPSSGCRAGGTP